MKQVTDGLLPRTDYIGLGDDERNTVDWVRWDDAAGVAGDALSEEPGYYPPRWRVRGWPSDRAVAELRRLAVEPGAGHP